MLLATANFDAREFTGLRYRSQGREGLICIKAHSAGERHNDGGVAMTNKGFSDPATTWNRRFDVPEFIFGRGPNHYLARWADRLPAGGRVLCVADGEGRNSVWLAARGFQVDAFDIAQAGVDKARALAREHGVEVDYRVFDCDAVQWPCACYDAVVAIFVQFAAPQVRARLFERMREALRPGGVLILQGFTPRQLEYGTGGPPLVDHLYTEELLRESFVGMEILDLAAYETQLTEGSQHRGHSAVIGLAARTPAP